MATNSDDIKWLYGKLKAKGYNVGTEQEFTSSLANEADRQWYYEKAKGMGLNMGSMADFNSMYAPQTAQPAPAPASAPRQQATPAAHAPASTPAPTAQAPTRSAPAPAPQQPKQPAWQPTEQDKIRMLYQIHTMLNDFNQRSRERIAQVQRMTEPFTAEGRKKRAAKKLQAQLAGTKTTAGPGLNFPSSQIYDGGSPQPYGVEYVDGKPVTQWLMPDGSLTTSQFAADLAEYTARKNRLRHQFENRMKQNGLDPAKPEDVEVQAQYDAQAPAYDAVAELWQEAEAAHKADKERNADREWSNYAAMGGGREMRIVTTAANRHADNISHMTRFDLQKMMDNAWARAGSKVTANCYNRLRQQYPDAPEEELQATASQMARQLTDNAVYQYAVQQNTPKSTLEYFGRTVADMNVINSISKGLARSQAGTSGDLAAYEAAMGEYGKNHRVAQIAGTVIGMAVDPVTWVSGGVGSLAGKGAINIGGRIVAGRAATSMSTQVGSRLFSSSLTGRIITGAAAGGGNFATYEMLKEGESQFLHGGHINPETGENEGYSAGAVLSAGGHGLILGSVTGTLSPVIGNVADKTVKATTSTAGKAGVRLGEVAVSTLAEGTIFSVPEWINGDADAMDVWTDNMAMMLGFKAQHGLKSAPRVIASLRPVKPVDGRPLTQAERNHNRMDFEERLRRNLDASPSDLSFTADEREELRRAGYGELADLFSRDRVQGVQRPDIDPAEGAIELRAERVEAETISRNPDFDGYSSMEELMQDGNVSQSARAKAYYILTGRRLPMASVTGYTTNTDADGRVTVNSIAANGEVVTSRTFKNEQEAKQETDNIMRQAELNSVDVGERYKEAVADDMVLDAAISEVSPGADPATIKRIYRAVKAGNKDVTELQKQLVEFLDDAIERNRDIADRYRPEAIREALKEETGIDVDAVLRKMPSKRTKAEQDAVKTYLERLFPEEARQQASEPTAEQAEAQSQYEQGRELFGRFEEGDPTVQADVDAIALRMQEAYQAVEDAFGSEAEYYMFHVNENPWVLVDDPELTVEQKDAVLYYINAKAALDGVMDASNEVADRKRAEVEESVAKRTHKDNGVIIPATMKVDDRPVYIVKGDVVMFPDGSAVDVHNSSESVVVMDAQTGEYQFTSPDQIFKVSEAVNPQDELDTALSVIEQEQMNIFGDNALAPEESAEGEEPQPDEADPFAQPAEAETPATADTEAYDRGYESGLNDAKNFDDVKLNAEIENLRNDADRLTDFGRGMLEAYEYEQQNRTMEAQSVPEMPETVPSAENEQQTALSRIPLNEKGEPSFEAVDKETAWDGLVEAVGGEDDAVEIALAQVQQATADLEALNKKPPTMKAPKLKGSPMAMAEAKRKAAEQYQNDLAQYNQQIAEAQARIDAWNGIVAVHNTRKAELRRQQEEERRAEPQQPVAGDTELEPLGKDRNGPYEDTPEEAALRARISVGEEWEEEGPAPDKPIYKRKLYVDGKHEVIQTDAPDKNGSYTGSQLTFDGRDFGDFKEIADYIDGGMQAQQAEPTEAQKAAGNYKMEHRRVDGYNISIENAKGSVRRGTGVDGKPWETTMQNDYGYIRGTEGVDGDHIDVFLSDTPEEGDVFVVDQVNEDGSFDEHKVMYGFPTEQAARDAYLSNYEPGWTGLGAITHVSKDEFKKWIQSSRRKTKPFAEYKSVKPIEGNGMIGRSLTEQEATELIARMKAAAEVAPSIELTPENWIAQFGEDGTVETPIGIVKMGANQLLKLYSLKRTEYFSMIHPTLNTPDVIIEKNAPAEGAERDSKYLFVKTFIKPDGSRLVHFESVTVQRDSMEVSISSHEAEGKAIKKEMQNGKILHLSESLSPSSERYLTEAPSESEGPDLVPTSDNIVKGKEREDGQSLILPSESSEEAGALSGPTLDSPSDRKVNTLSADKQTESAESSKPYTITPTTYTNKKGKTSDVHLVKFNRELTAEEKAALDTFAREPLTEGKKTSRGWYDRKQGGYMMRSEEAARQLAEMIGNEEAVADAQPMTADELREAVAPAASAEKKLARKPKKAPINRVSLEDVMTDLSTKGETKLSDHAEPVKAEPEQQHEISDDEMKSLADELRDLLGIGDDEGDTNIKFRDPGELTAQERQRIQSAGIRLAMGLIERGTTAFPDYATKMVGLLGDKIRPWLKSFYEGARWTPGYDKYAFTPTEQVATFDVQNFDKKQADPIAQAAMIVEERKAGAASAQAQKELTETRNKNRRENDKQTEADTAALAEKAEAVAGEAEVTAQSAGTGEAGRKRILRDLKRVDDTLEEVNDQLALLGYYEAEEVDKDFNEAYGYMRNAEKKAVKDAVDLAKQLVNDLGLGLDKVTGSTTANRGKRKNAVTANIAPAGGDISIRLPLNEGRELYITIGLDPSVTPGDVTYSGDNLQTTRIMYRVEWPDEKGHVSFDRMGRNCWADANVTYADLLNGIQREAKEYLPSSTPAEEPAKAEPQKEAYHGTVTLKDGREAVVISANHVQNIGEPSRLTDYIVGVKGEPGTIKISPDEIAHAGAPTAEDKPSTPAQAEETHNGYKIGDEVLWDRYGNDKWEKQTIVDFEKDGSPIFDSMGMGMMMEIGDWSRIKPADGIFGEAQRVVRKTAEDKQARAERANAVADEVMQDKMVSEIFDIYMKKFGSRKEELADTWSEGKSEAINIRLPYVRRQITQRLVADKIFSTEKEADRFFHDEILPRLEKQWMSKAATDNAVSVLKGGKKPAKKRTEVKPEQPVADLFGGLFDEPISNEKKTDVQPRPGTAERERGHEPQSHEPLGESQRNEVKGTDRRGMGGRSSVNPMSDGERGAGVPRKPKSQPVIEPVPESERKNVRNNHAERGVDYAPKGEDARIKANMEAIELAKRLLDAGETATPEQMAVLRKFSGWGGLGKAFNEQGYTPNPIAKRLKELLGEDGYQDAVDSRRSAYYTPAEVIDTMWDVARAMGFKGGNVLEGSAGIGNIIGLMPTDMSERSSIHAVEIDRTTGGILSLLYPDAKVEIQGFEKTRVQNGTVDLAITNVPFITGAKVFDETGDKDLSKKFHDIHDFCIAKNIRKLREGGIGIFITSSGTMDNSKELRLWIIGEGNADVVGAFRMHNKTFGGTGATSDIIVVRKRVNGKPSPNAIDVTDAIGVRVADYDTGDTRKVKGQEIPVIKQYSMMYNKYFAEHPENMAGEMMFNFERGETRFPTSRALFPVKEKEQSKMLVEWAGSFADMEEEATAAPKVEDEITRINEQLGEGVKEGSMVLNSQGELCMARMGEAVPLGLNKNKVKGHTKAECFKAYSAIKKALSDVLEYQSSNEGDEGLAPLLKELNRAFDTFTRTYGNLHKNTAISFLRNDVDFSSILALETYSEKGDKKGNKVVKVGKTDIFSRRVIDTEKEPQPTTIKDAILASLYKSGGVDVEYIGQALGKPTEEVKREIVSSGLGFENPSTGTMEVSYKYLSGNVREKLHIAQENNADGRYDANIKALEGVMPMTIPAHLIEFSLGSSWIEPKLYEDFVFEKTGIRVKLTNVGGTWFMKTPWSTFNEKNRAMAVVSKMCDKTIMGHELIESAITNKQITVSKTDKHYDGSTETITDKAATAECGTKVDEIRAEFKDWAREHMQADPAMSARIEQTYNDQFNNYVPMSIPDEFVPQHFGGQVSELHGHPFALRPHQGRAVVRGTTEPILLAHEVGTGKTYTLITTAMEMRRLGTARKPMIVVQNATVGQFVESAKEIYPNAKVLTIEEADRTAEGRKNFYAKIKYNDWDMIVVPQSVFERIPDSEEREMAYVKDIIEEKMKVLEAMRDADSDGRSMIVRQAERELAEQEARLAELTETMQVKKKKRDEKREATTRQNAEVRALEMLDREVDDVENFDDMGIDAILVDEAHEYKHLGFATAMQRGVKGVDPSYSKKSQGVFLKAQAVMERNNGRNVVFATGTPISNTAAEIWTFMRYLMPVDTMKSYGIYYFDDFVRNFGNIAQMVEFSTNGKFKENNRFAGYVNLPELVRIWSSVADTVLTREAGGVSDKIPDMEGGKPQDIYLPQTRALRSVMKYVKAELDRYDKMTGKEKKENSHIPLTMYGIAKAAAVDVRLVVPNAEDDPNSKTNATVRETLRSLRDSEKYKGTVAIFSDNYQNKQSGFNLYEDIRKKLIAEGVPAEQIVVIKPGMTVKRKLDIFEKVNAGEIRVIMGSTFTLGTGVNIQERLHTLIHVDAPNRPMDYTQRNGRALRQGNLHKDMGIPVRIIRFGVEDSLDVTAYQRLKTKGAIADSIMNGSKMMQNSMENRVLEEEEDSFGDMTAQLSGSEYAILKDQAEREVRNLTAKQKGHDLDQIYVHNQLPKVEGFIKGAERRIEIETKNLEIIGSHFPDGTIKKITIGKLTFDSVAAMEDFFKEQNAKMNEAAENVREGADNYTSKLVVDVDGLKFEVTTTVSRTVDSKGQGTLTFEPERNVTYSCEELGIKDQAIKGNRLKNIMQKISEDIVTGRESRELLSRGQQQLAHYTEERTQLEQRNGREFPYKKELAEAKERLAKYEEAMKKELAEKEAKYAELDKSVETASDITLTDEDSTDTPTTGDGNKYRLVAERELLDFLDAQPLKKGYRYSQWANMGVLPPMTAKQNGEWRAPMIFSSWEQSEEGMRKENGKADLVQGNGRTTGDVAYNPYFHIRTSPLNDQFTAAYDRPELLVVEGYYPESEETSGYQAEGAKDSVGLMDWHSGSVNGQLSDDTKVQTMLSRYFKPGRIVPWSEVADLIMERVGDQKITFPINAVPPMLRAELAKRGAKFGDISGSVAEADIPMLNELRDRVNAGEWDAGLEKARAYIDAYESSAEAKEARVADLSARANTPVRIVRTQEEADALPTRRERRAKGWWSAKDDEVVIVLPNNVNVADVDNTFVHEVAGHKGLRALVGEERFDEFLGEIYSHASNPIRKVIDKMTDRMVSEEADRLRVRKAQAHERAGEDVNANYYTDMAEARVEAEKKREEFRKESTEEYMSDLGGRIGSEGFEKMSRDEMTLWGKIKAKVQAFLDKFLRGLKIAKSIRLNDKDLSYILYKSWKNLRKKDVFAYAEDVVMRRRTGYDADEVTRFRDPGLGLEETITKMKAEAMQANAGNLQAKRDAMRAIDGNLNHLRQAMARQREYDITTVKSVADLARVLMDNNLLDDLSKYETKRILGAINNVVGKQDVSQYVQKVMDIMVDNQLRMGANTLGRLLSIRGSRVDARGIEVQGELDPDGQRIAQVVRKSTSLPKADIEERIAEALNRMGSDDQAVADEAALEYSGLLLAHQFAEDITESKSEEKALRDSIREAKEAKDAGQMTEDAYRQYVESTEDAIRQNKIERAEAFHSLVEQVGGVLSESVERAKAWREAEKQRVEEIHHNANSDMEGRPTDEHHKDDRMQEMANNSFARFLLSPLATFDQMLRMFGKKDSRGEGYLWNRYMRDWVTATEKEYTGYRDALKVLDAKVSEIYGKDMTWGDLFTIDRKLPKASVRFFDGGEMKDHELTQGNLLYIYMADKMSDGRMKLRRMGITEEDIEDIMNFLDPKFMQLADWMQEEFLIDKRNEYNEVHKRMFGASMAAIENYFPLKILANARLEDVDVADDTTDTALPATSTGSIIKRRRNNLALDVTGANAFSVILDHLQQMERWAAFAEFNRDLNTLLSYKRFRNQVMNMSSVYGAGKTLWNNFRNVCSMAAGAYRPPIATLDKLAVNIAKGATAAKVSFRVFTALKQFLSMPAYASDSNPLYLAANIANPIGAWRWSMENLPLFEKRWRSRMAGDPRLLKSEMDWKTWRSRVAELASRVGMAPNAFVDALTVAIGAHAMYQTKLAKYKRMGYDPDVAEERAKQDATILFNQTQQSSEGAFLSTMQVDRSWLSVLFTVFRNSSMSYTRQLYDSIRNIGRRLTPDYKAMSEEFMAKQMRRDGIDPDKADRNAKQEYRRGIIRDLVRVGIFGYVLQLAWNLGAYLPYLIFGDDDDEKYKMWDDVFTHTMFGSIEGLTGGDVYSNTLNAWAKGEKITPWVASKDMPLSSDLENIWTKLNTDEVSAMNDVINLLVQSAVGVNPQSLTDAVVAVMDVCGDDAQTSRECALLMTRIINCPQSQLDKIYFDELGTTGEEASQMTPYEIAERYARYKVRRGAPLTGWAYGNEQREKIMDKYRKKSNTLAKERLTRETDTQASPNMTQWLEEFEATKDRVSDIKKVKSRDEDRYYELLDQLEATPEFSRYEIIRAYKHDVDELTNEWLNARTAAQRDSCAQAILTLKREMVRELSDTQQ